MPSKKIAATAADSLIRITDGIRITPPAVVTLIGYIVMAIVVMLPFEMEVWDDAQQEYVKYRYDLLQRILLLMLMLFPLLLGVYSVNCFVVGKCHVLSWVTAAITLVWAVAIVIAAFLNRSFNVDNLFM